MQFIYEHNDTIYPVKGRKQQGKKRENTDS